MHSSTPPPPWRGILVASVQLVGTQGGHGGPERDAYREATAQRNAAGAAFNAAVDAGADDTTLWGLWAELTASERARWAAERADGVARFQAEKLAHKTRIKEDIAWLDAEELAQDSPPLPRNVAAREVLAAICELHSPKADRPDSCRGCESIPGARNIDWPCATRRLADQWVGAEAEQALYAAREDTRA